MGAGTLWCVGLPWCVWGAVQEAPAALSPLLVSPSSLVDEEDFTAPGPLQGALSKAVLWSPIKMSFYWRSASFKERRIYWSGCWLLATRLYLSIPLSFCFFCLLWFLFPLSSFLGLSPFHLKTTDGSLPCCSCNFFQLFIVVFSRSSCREPGKAGARLQSSQRLHRNNSPSPWMLWVSVVLQASPLRSSLVRTRLQLMRVSAVPSLVDALLIEARGLRPVPPRTV